MNILKLTTQFKKDLKRYKHKLETLNKLEVILNLLKIMNLFRKNTDLIY